ncbi:CSS-motif domain-containing protein [Caballeronia temeraria]|uniref:CSS-motif domain-containing protein n=1 Tax=Caballeronia temeraria TaxID=1777137 RepID=UPI001FC932CC|nr:CSS-motif domain-containing protein [Caballeronia temeraria]
MLSAVALGEHYANGAIHRREELVAGDMIESVERILRHVMSSQREPLDRLPGQRCETEAKLLAELKTHVRYVRGVNLFQNGHLYCSSALGPMNVPLSAYISTAQRDLGISLIRGTPYQPAVPVLPVFRSTGHGTGLLYVIEGAYVADILAHGLRYGASKVTLSVTGSGAIDEHGVSFATGVAAAPRPRTLVGSAGLPLLRDGDGIACFCIADALEVRCDLLRDRGAAESSDCRVLPACFRAAATVAVGRQTRAPDRSARGGLSTGRRHRDPPHRGR